MLPILLGLQDSRAAAEPAFLRGEPAEGGRDWPMRLAQASTPIEQAGPLGAL